MTKNAAPKLNQRGPVESASQERIAVARMQSSPLISQAIEGLTDRSNRIPP